jgi:Ala-tRNA(Pro) deacylase
MPVAKVREFLEEQHVNYTSTAHSPAFTSQEVAAAAHVSGRRMAKVVVIKLDGRLAMVVLPANHHVNFSALRHATKAHTVDLAAESEFKDKFPGCEVGAMPPFGELFHMPVYLSEELSHEKNLQFNAGSHSELMQVSYEDFNRLSHPIVVEI